MYIFTAVSLKGSAFCDEVARKTRFHQVPPKQTLNFSGIQEDLQGFCIQMIAADCNHATSLHHVSLK